MPNFAQITLAGHLGRDAETRYTASGKPVTSFSLCVNTGYGDRKVSSWYNVTLWNKEQLATYLTKGKAVLVSGEPVIRPYETKDGEKRFSFDVTANAITFLGGKDDARDEYDQRPQPRAAAKREAFTPPKQVPFDQGGDAWQGVDDSDVPF